MIVRAPERQAVTYAEAAYFDGAPVAHCAAWQENARLRRIAAQFRAAHQRRQPRFEVLA